MEAHGSMGNSKATASLNNPTDEDSKSYALKHPTGLPGGFSLANVI